MPLAGDAAEEPLLRAAPSDAVELHCATAVAGAAVPVDMCARAAFPHVLLDCPPSLGPLTVSAGTTSYIGGFNNGNGSLTIGGNLLGSGTLSTIATNGTHAISLSGDISGFSGMYLSTAVSGATSFIGNATAGTAATWVATVGQEPEGRQCRGARQ